MLFQVFGLLISIDRKKEKFLVLVVTIFIADLQSYIIQIYHFHVNYLFQSLIKSCENWRNRGKRSSGHTFIPLKLISNLARVWNRDGFSPQYLAVLIKHRKTCTWIDSTSDALSIFINCCSVCVLKSKRSRPEMLVAANCKNIHDIVVCVWWRWFRQRRS